MAVTQEAIDAALARVNKLADSFPEDMMGLWVGLLLQKEDDDAFLQKLAKLHLRFGDKDAAFKAGLEALGFPCATGSRDASLPQLADDQVQRFWRALSTTQINADGVLGLPLGVFFMGVRENGSRLMVRQAYTQLWDVAEDLLRSGCKRLVVRGTPGIGKSWWLFFVMHKAACAGVTVVLDSEDEQARFLFRGDIVMKGDLRNSFDQELSDETTWYLVDGRMPVAVKARTIAAVSPAREKYYQYSKAPGVEIRYMPLWSLEELERARQLVFPHISKEQVEKKYEVWGGTARYCLQFAASNLDAVLRGALARTDLKQLVSDMGALEVNEEVSNRLVHWSVFPDFTQKTTVFASEAIKKEVTDLLWKRGREEVLRELKFIMGRREYTSLAGALFETVTHDKICAGGEFLIRDLEQPGAAVVPMSFPRAKEVLFKDEREFKKYVLQEAGPCYCVPTSLTFAAVDALSPPRSLFQATIAERHPVKEAGLSDALKLLPEEDEYHLYFAVPEQRFADFKKQTITAVKSTTVQDMQPAKMNGKLKRVRQFALKIVARSALRVAPRALVV